jgi:3-dehydroquinate synthetase
LENQYELSHGEAISIGMAYASVLSEKMKGFKQTGRVVRALERYNLPTLAEFDKDKVMSVLKMDKKKVKNNINFILLEKIGKAVIQKISIDQLYESL